MNLSGYSIRRPIRVSMPEELRPLAEDRRRRFRITVDSERHGEGLRRHTFRHEALIPSDQELTTSFFAELEVPHSVGSLEVLDPFVMILAFRQMTFGGVLEVDGPISRRLMHNLVQIQALSHNRWPKAYRPFAIEADRIIEDPYGGNRRPLGVLAMTGGLDSTLTLYRETDPHAAGVSHPLGMAVTIVGYNPAGDRVSSDYEEKHLARIRRICGRRNLDVGVIRTDLWKIPNYVVKPHGAVLGGLLALSAPAFGFGLLASSAASGEAWLERGCAPEWQWSYGTGGFDVPSSLGLFTRPERLVQLARYGSDICDDLIVCGTAENLPENCGYCAKCVRTMLTFEAAGLPIPKCFPAEIDERQIGFGASKQPEIGYYAEIVSLMDALGTDTPALRIMRRRYLKKFLKRKLLDLMGTGSLD